MKLTSKEQAVCDEYSKRGADGFVRCHECPLNIDAYELKCYATIDGRTTEAKKLRRWK